MKAVHRKTEDAPEEPPGSSDTPEAPPSYRYMHNFAEVVYPYKCLPICICNTYISLSPTLATP